MLITCQRTAPSFARIASSIFGHSQFSIVQVNGIEAEFFFVTNIEEGE